MANVEVINGSEKAASAAAECGKNQVYNKTLEACQKVAGGGGTKESGGLMDFLFSTEVVAIFMLAAGIYIGVTYLANRDKEEKYEHKELSDRLQDKIERPAYNWGDRVNKPLDYGPSQKGVVMNAYGTTEKDALPKFDEEDDDPVQKDDVKSIVGTNKDISMYTFIYRKKGFGNWLRAKFGSTSAFDNKSKFVLRIPREIEYTVRNEDGDLEKVTDKVVEIGERIQVSDNLDLQYEAGMWIGENGFGYRDMQNKAGLSMLQDYMEGISDTPRRILKTQDSDLLSRLIFKSEESKQIRKAMKQKQDNEIKEGTD